MVLNFALLTWATKGYFSYFRVKKLLDTDQTAWNKRVGDFIEPLSGCQFVLVTGTFNPATFTPLCWRWSNSLQENVTSSMKPKTFMLFFAPQPCVHGLHGIWILCITVPDCSAAQLSFRLRRLFSHTVEHWHHTAIYTCRTKRSQLYAP